MSYLAQILLWQKSGRKIFLRIAQPSFSLISGREPEIYPQQASAHNAIQKKPRVSKFSGTEVFGIQKPGKPVNHKEEVFKNNFERITPRLSEIHEGKFPGEFNPCIKDGSRSEEREVCYIWKNAAAAFALSNLENRSDTSLLPKSSGFVCYLKKIISCNLL
ncbi:hypothetical protein NPIL_159071 [Nephila pilipes]|uniref:Uncharacterized protein n=1 Tax=Nephila pilipes TaxID=299642 RepID=A0A8X6NIK3_NEPPI|nr:hypothetical protein NPIL_159071 [Nephila pilipes]